MFQLSSSVTECGGGPDSGTKTGTCAAKQTRCGGEHAFACQSCAASRRRHQQQIKSRPLPQIKASQESGFQRPEASSLFHKLSSLDRSAFGTDRGYPESTGLFDCLLARLRQPFFFDRRLRQPLLHCSGATLRKHLCNKVKKESFCMARHQQDRAGVSGLISQTPHARTRPSFFLPTR
jgi:hypothetical protein